MPLDIQKCQLDKLSTAEYPFIEFQLVGHCKDCHWLLPDALCRMILWGPRQPDIAKATTEVAMVASYSLKVHPTKFGCSLWREKRESRKE